MTDEETINYLHEEIKLMGGLIFEAEALLCLWPNEDLELKAKASAWTARCFAWKTVGVSDSTGEEGGHR